MQSFNENLKSNDPEIIYNSILNVYTWKKKKI